MSGPSTTPLFALALWACVHEVKAPPRSPVPAGKIAVVGAVAAAGLYDFRPGMTALQALGAAGGLSHDAAPDRAALTRFVSGLAATVPIRLNAIADGREPDVPLDEGDILQVPPAAPLPAAAPTPAADPSAAPGE